VKCPRKCDRRCIFFTGIGLSTGRVAEVPDGWDGPTYRLVMRRTSTCLRNSAPRVSDLRHVCERSQWPAIDGPA
jgi:hypothetical protein